MKAIVTIVNPVNFGQPPYLTQIIDDANAQELKGDFLFIFKQARTRIREDRAAFRAADVVKVIFEKEG